MGKRLITLYFIISFYSLGMWAQEQQLLLQKTLNLATTDLHSVLQKTESDIKVFAENFKVRLDKKSKIVSPQVVTGSVLEPVLKVSIEKCVAIFCQTIDLDAAFKLQILDVEKEAQPNNTCDHSYLLIVDFSRSSSMLSDLYQSMNTTICITRTANGAQAQLQISLVHAESYSEGIVQKKAFELISLQPQAIIESFTTVMKINGVTDIQILD